VNKKNNDLAIENLKGKISIITETLYDVEMQYGEQQTGDTISRIVSKYNKQGNEVEYYYYNSTKLEWKSTSKVNDDGKVVESTNYGEDGTVYNSIALKYNEKGNLIEKDSYFTNSSLNEKNIYKYDENNNRIEYNRYTSDGALFTKYAYQFDNKGNYIELEIYLGNNLDSKFKCKYDDNNNLIEEKVYRPNGAIIREDEYKYDDYDKTGNWLSQTQFEQGKPKSIKRHEIQYYKAE
jgi:hypothetical protein